jgi:hypothetical protein
VGAGGGDGHSLQQGGDRERPEAGAGGDGAERGLPGPSYEHSVIKDLNGARVSSWSLNMTLWNPSDATANLLTENIGARLSVIGL